MSRTDGVWLIEATAVTALVLMDQSGEPWALQSERALRRLGVEAIVSSLAHDLDRLLAHPAFAQLSNEAQARLFDLALCSAVAGVEPFYVGGCRGLQVHGHAITHPPRHATDVARPHPAPAPCAAEFCSTLHLCDGTLERGRAAHHLRPAVQCA